MLKLFAIAVLFIVTIGAATAQTSDTPTPGADPSAAASTSSTQLDAQKKLWFDNAVGHILGNDH